MGPKLMFIRVSENCNGGCFMCNYAHKNDSYNISKEEVEYLISEMNKQGSYKMARFTGGEPLINKDLCHFIKRFKEEGYLTSIITNGFLLPVVGEDIAKAGLDQVIISIDGSKDEYNDELRGLRNSISRIKEGIKIIRSINPKINIRANTVASSKNISDLKDIHKLLNELDFDCWSIIPIRGKSSVWEEDKIDEYKKIYNEFIESQKKYDKPHLLGYSKMWAGRNDEEITETFKNGFRISPTNKCIYVDNLRFYIPDKKLLVPCNCAAHRINQIDTDYSKEENIFKQADIMADWLRENGPTHCTGCEPLNAYLSDHPEVIDENIFEF